MCGIFGSVGFGINLTKQLDSMTHRGPDASGEYVNQALSLYLGHRRLSILDLSDAGRQPMSTNNNSLQITYNGEIYNFKDIKNELFRGLDFFSQTDTEVLLYLYEKFGSRMPTYLRGMFAFGIYDSLNEELYLCRDRVGIKPLYYYQKGDKFVFSSELQSIKNLPGIDLEVDPIGLDHYFSLGYIPAPYSAYKHIKKLRPAHFLRYSLKSNKIVAIESYWDLNDQIPKYTFSSEEEWLDAIENKIKECVKIRLISDVPLGAFLSGGVDSSLVVASMAGMTDRPVKTFTVGFPYQEFDERGYADEVSRKYQTDHYDEVVYPEALSLLPMLVRSFGEPFADSSAIPTYYVSKIARKNVTVALSGDGGDEVFAGYTRYLRAHRYASLGRVPYPVRALVKDAGQFLPRQMKGYGFLQRQGYSDIIQVYSSFNSFFSREEKENLFSPELKKALVREEKHLFEKVLDEHPNLAGDLITKLQCVDLHCYLPDDILTKVDRMSMLNSLETRVPLLDHELIEMALSCPSSIRFKSHDLKYILKQILSKHLPKEFIYRKKQGFSMPVNKWFRGDWKDALQDMCESMKKDPHINNQYISDMVNMHQKGGRNFGNLLYSLLFYKYWLNAE
jgi:asparagine synthase (glutamine-hydrolysing)